MDVVIFVNILPVRQLLGSRQFDQKVQYKLLEDCALNKTDSTRGAPDNK